MTWGKESRQGEGDNAIEQGFLTGVPPQQSSVPLKFSGVPPNSHKNSNIFITLALFLVSECARELVVQK